MEAPDRWAHLHEGGEGALPPGAGDREEGVHDVDGVVHAQPDPYDHVHGRDGVDGEAPEVHEPAEVRQGGRHAHQHQQGPQQVGQQQQGSQENTGQGKAKVPHLVEEEEEE